MLDTLRKAFAKATSQNHLPPNVSGTVSLADKAQAITLPTTTPNVKTVTQPGGNDIFNEGGQYPPGEPLMPLEPNRRPQQFQFGVGRNIVITPRTEEGRTPFQMLRSFADSHDVSRLCIEIRKEQIGGMDWDIIPINAEDRDLTKKYKSQIIDVKDFLQNPDGKSSWYDWLGQVLEEVFVVDALTLYKRKTRGGKLYALEVVDGSTIKPLIDSFGRTPLPPYPAYQQIIYGYPRGSSGTPTTQGFTADDLVYNPKNKRAWTMYGFSPIEYIIMKINLALNRDMFMLSWFNQGTIPDGGIYSLPPTSEFTGDVEKIQQLQEYIDDLVGGVTKRRSGSILFLPDGKFQSTKEFKFDPAVDEWLARIAAVAFGVNPQHFVKMMTRSTGETQKEMTSEIAVKPSLRYLESILTSIMKEFWEIKGMKFKFLDEDDDQALEVEKNVQYVKAGIMSIDEVRGGDLGLPPIFGEGESLPNMVFTASGFMPITRETVQQAAAPPPAAPIHPGLPGTPGQADKDGNPLKPSSSAPAASGGSTKDEDAAKGLTTTAGKGAKETAGASPTPNKSTSPPASAKKKTKAELNKMERYWEYSVTKKLSRAPFHSAEIPKPLLKCLNAQAAKMTEPLQVHALFKAVARRNTRKNATLAAAVQKYQDIYSNMLGDESAKFNPKIDAAKSAEEAAALVDDHNFFVGYDIGPIADEAVNLKRNTYNDAETILSGMTGDEIDLHFSSDIAAEKAIQYAGDLIKDLSDSTRESLKSTIAASVNNEEDWQTLKDRLMTSYDFSDRRAETIARTESGRLYNEGFIAAARESGIVSKVLVFDGEEYDDECAAANGEEWTLDEAEANPLEHPNCVREFQYIIDGE